MKSFISRKVFDAIRPNPELVETHQSCFGITGEQLCVEGIVEASLSFSSSALSLYTGEFLISDHLFQPLQCILGWDFLTSNQLQLLYKGQGAYFLVEKHGETPLAPKASDTSPISTVGRPLHCDSSATVTSSLLVQSSSRGHVNVSQSTGLCIPSRTEVVVTVSSLRVIGTS